MTHQLTKQEIDKLLDLTSFIAAKQDEHRRIIEALNLQFKIIIATEVLPRLQIEATLLDKCVIDAQNGTLIVQEDEPPQEEAKEEVPKL